MSENTKPAVAKDVLLEDETAKPLPEIKAKNVWKMIIGCALGLLLFCIPLPWNGKENPSTMLLSFIKVWIEEHSSKACLIIALAVIYISLVMTIYMLFTKKKKHGKIMHMWFEPTILNIIVRACAAVIASMVFFNFGPYWILSEDTGGLMFKDLMPSLILFFYLGIVLLYFLTDFGLMELIGSLVERFFRPLFHIPARSVVLCLSAWFGSGTVQLLPIESEYKKGYLTDREAAIIMVGFCTIPFGAMLAYSVGIAGLEDQYFFPMFLTTVLVAVVAMFIMCRIPPLTWIKDEYYEGHRLMYKEGKGGPRIGFRRAYRKVEKSPSVGHMFKEGSLVAVDLYFEVFPLIITLGTLVTILASFTPVFNWISTPFVPILKAIGVPQPADVAPALFTGFADLLLPFISAAYIDSQLATFILCVVGVSQIICMTETGLIMSKSKVSLTIPKLFGIFLEKTLVALLIGLLVGRLLGIPA